jgi:hypothetical protein
MAKRKNPRALKSHAKKPGRKPKLSVGEAARANDEAPAEYRNRIGIITEFGPGRTDYRIEFEDGQRPTTGYLSSRWLDPV